MLDSDKKSVGVLFRQIREAHQKKLLHEYKFHESSCVEHNPANTICVTIEFLKNTPDKQRTRVVEYIRHNFRVVQVSHPQHNHNIATIVLNLVPGAL